MTTSVPPIHIVCWVDTIQSRGVTFGYVIWHSLIAANTGARCRAKATLVRKQSIISAE